MDTNTATIKIYDTTLRDGTQGEGIAFSVADKIRIAQRLDEFGVDYIEGGFPGSNPRDIAFFSEARKLKLKRARLAAFGATRRAGIKASDDAQIKALLDSGMPVMTIVGKTWTLHVTEIIRATLEENLAMIQDSVAYLVAQEREVIYDAEHFFDGYKADADYALRTLAAAMRGGASNLTLCDTNGGALVDEFKAIVARVVKEFGGDRVGVHCHNDSGLGVALSLAGVTAGATLVQGTVNGYGERVGNANMTTILPNLFLKMGKTAYCAPNLAQLRDLSLFFDELANLRPDPKAPYVGASANADKGGQHANATGKVARSYRHIDPALVGNYARVLVSDLAGMSSLVIKAKELGFDVTKDTFGMSAILQRVKELEHEGYEFEAADGSLSLLILQMLSPAPLFFAVEEYHVSIHRDEKRSVCEAAVKVCVPGKPTVHATANGDGPVNALDGALRLALVESYPNLQSTRLTDYKVRIINSNAGTAARTRVLIESTDGVSTWVTVGVHENIVEASLQALVDSLKYRLSTPERSV